MTRARGETWRNWVTGVGIVALVLLGSWCWRTTVILQSVSAQEASPYAGMVEIPGGSFTMGRDDGPANERPAHQVFLPTFYIDRNMVTVVEFTTFVQAKGPTGPHGEMYLDVHDPDNRIQQRDGVWSPEKGFELHPVGEVSWFGALAYCQWRQKRLPSEAEWEKAARGTDGRLYPWGNDAPRPDLAFFGGLRGQTVPIGLYPKGASPYGVLDMAGQAWEWTTSLYKPYPYDAQDGREDLTVAASRVARGGSSSSPPEGLTSTSREIISALRQTTGHAYIGFRCVKPLEMLSQATTLQGYQDALDLRAYEH
jgi:formylglycine-generating enzyme required for sulfatase activity